MLTKQPSPTEQELNRLAVSLAHRIAHQEADVDDLVQEGLLSLHRMLRKHPRPNKPFAFARTLMQRSMLIYYSGGWRYSGARHREDLSFTAAPPDRTTHDPRRRWDNDLDLDAYLTALETTHGALARLVADNLLAPQDEDYCQLLHETAQHKTRLKKKGKNTRGANHIRPSHCQLRKALHLTRTEWHRTLHAIRQFTATYLAWTSDAATLPTCVERYQVPD